MLAIHSALAARVPKVTQKSNHKEYRVSGADGIKDLKIAHLSASQREQGEASKDGQYLAAKSEESLDDVKARAKRFGLELDSRGHSGLGLN